MKESMRKAVKIFRENIQREVAFLSLCLYTELHGEAGVSYIMQTLTDW